MRSIFLFFVSVFVFGQYQKVFYLDQAGYSISKFQYDSRLYYDVKSYEINKGDTLIHKLYNHKQNINHVSLPELTQIRIYLEKISGREIKKNRDIVISYNYKTTPDLKRETLKKDTIKELEEEVSHVKHFHDRDISHTAYLQKYLNKIRKAEYFLIDSKENQRVLKNGMKPIIDKQSVLKKIVLENFPNGALLIIKPTGLYAVIPNTFRRRSILIDYGVFIHKPINMRNVLNEITPKNKDRKKSFFFNTKNKRITHASFHKEQSRYLNTVELYPEFYLKSQLKDSYYGRKAIEKDYNCFYLTEKTVVGKTNIYNELKNLYTEKYNIEFKENKPILIYYYSDQSKGCYRRGSEKQIDERYMKIEHQIFKKADVNVLPIFKGVKGLYLHNQNKEWYFDEKDLVSKSFFEPRVMCDGKIIIKPNGSYIVDYDSVFRVNIQALKDFVEEKKSRL